MQEEKSSKAKFLLNCFPQLQVKILKEQLLQYKPTGSSRDTNTMVISIIGSQHTGKSSTINAIFGRALSTTNNLKEQQLIPYTSQMTQQSLQFIDVAGFSNSEYDSDYLKNILLGIQPSISRNDLEINLSVIQHPLADIRAKAVMRLNDAKTFSTAATRTLMTVAFGDINYGVRDIANAILEQRSLRSQYLSLLGAFDVLLKMNLPTQIWTNFFEVKPEYLQYCIAHCEDDSAKKAKLFRLLSEAAHQSIQVYKSISYLTFRFKMASELMQAFAKDEAFVVLNHLTPADEKLKGLVNARIFEHATAIIHVPSHLPGPAYSDNPNTFFSTQNQAKKNKASQDKKQKEKANTRYENNYGNKGKIFQP